MNGQEREANTVIYFNSELIGTGDDELGAILMTNFLSTTGDFINDVSHILLVNSGVKLACEGSDNLELLQMLADSGVKILACVTCLNHFGLKEQFKAGSVSNMFSILETLNRAERVIIP